MHTARSLPSGSRALRILEHVSESHPRVIDLRTDAPYRPEKMGKSTVFASPRLLVGLNAFEPGQEHPLHTHPGMDKMYLVIEGHGTLLLDDRAEPMPAGAMTVVPEGVLHGLRNDGPGRLLVLAVLAPAPRPHD